jgi:hypothetical protein
VLRRGSLTEACLSVGLQTEKERKELVLYIQEDEERDLEQVH